MSEPTLFKYAVTVKGNLDNGASVHGTIFSHKKCLRKKSMRSKICVSTTQLPIAAMFFTAS